MILAGSLASCGGSKTKAADSSLAVADPSAGSDSVVGSDSVMGSDAANGSNGSDGLDGVNESDGVEGADGADGADGANGADGSSVDAGVDSGAVSSVAGAAGSKVPLVLTGNGIDGSKFGDKFETVMSAMTAAHGAFDDDSLWEDQQAPCEGLGTKERRVQWGSVVLMFSNGPTQFGAAGVEHFTSVYSEDAATSSVAVNAPDGKALLDETVGNLKRRFPNVEIYNSEITGPSFQLKTDSGEIDGILSGLTDKDSVVSFNEGLICMD